MDSVNGTGDTHNMPYVRAFLVSGKSLAQSLQI